MKLTSIKLFVISAILTCTSCQGLLDVSPDGRKTLDDVFASEVSTKFYLNTCYANFPKYGFNYYNWTNHIIGYSDDSWEHGGSGVCNYVYAGSVTSALASNRFIKSTGPATYQNAGTSIWDVYYRNIRRCNVFLEKIGTAAVPNETDRNRWTAEAYVLRAFYYMTLISDFGGVPIIDYVPSASFDTSTLTRASFKECADFIIKDCDTAIAMADLPWRNTVSGEATRMTKGIAYAIKSRVALFAASPLFCDGEDHWDWALAQTKDALETLQANGYALYNTVSNEAWFSDNPYSEYYKSTVDYSDAPRDTQTILSNTMPLTNLYNVAGHPYPKNDKGKVVKTAVPPTQELVDAYPMANGKYILDLENPYKDEKHLEPNYDLTSGYDPENPYEGRDPRLTANVFYNGAWATNSQGKKFKMQNYYKGDQGPLATLSNKYSITGYYQAKYLPPQQTPSNKVAVNYKIMHLGELYLNYAEALLESGNYQAALEALNDIRDRARMPHMAASNADEARLMLHNERRIELALEENRYYDCRRWTEPGNDIMGPYLTGMWIEKIGTDKFEYHRHVIGTIYNSATKTWSGNEILRANFSSKYLLHPIEQAEVSRLESATGDTWQNPGW